MSERYPWTEEQKAEWEAWLSTRPAAVAEVGRRIVPNRLYRMKGTGHRVFPISFGEQEDGSVTVTVAVTAEYNFVVMERQVFGIEPGDLEECDLPAPDELLGSMDLSVEQVRDLMGPAVSGGATGGTT